MKHSKKRGEGRENKPRRYKGSGFPLSRVLKCTFGFATALVVFVTAYAMVLPALTVSVPRCGIDEHTHTEECYREEKKLICDNTDGEHIHTEGCYSIRDVLECDREAHTHTDECFEEQPDPQKPEKEAEPVGADNEDAAGLSGDDLSAYRNFEEYLESAGGTIESLLFDKNSNCLDNIHEASGSGYTYVLRLSSPKIVPDTYFYYLPKGINIELSSRKGDISNGSSVIGTYTISDDTSYILFTFNKESVNYQNISGQIKLSASFEEIIGASVDKSGWLISPDGVMDGYFHFRISARIPADREGLNEKQWSFLDRSEITNPWIYDFGSPENAENTKVSISYGSVTDYELHNISEVYTDSNVQLAYYIDESTKELILVNRCTCADEKLCLESESGHCSCSMLKNYPGWCSCWCLGENATVDITYKNAVNGADGTYILQNQNSLEKAGTLTYENRVTLTGTDRDSTVIKKATASVEYGNMIEKHETVKASEEGGYQSEFRIAVNKDKADFSKLDADGDGKYDKQVVVRDEMNNLKLVPGSMRITAEDADGGKTELNAGTDFNVDVKQTDTGAQLEISINKLGRFTYCIDYNTQVYSQEKDKTIEISNDVFLRLYRELNNPGYRYSRRFIYSEQWDYLKYEVELLKVDYNNHKLRLEGAVYGLYSADGTLMAERTTDKDGRCTFATNAVEGLIFSTDTMYYIKEISPPKGYDINIAPYWFYFSRTRDSEGEHKLEEAYPGVSITYVAPNDDKSFTAKMELTDEKCFVLPETGSDGTNIYFFTGSALIAAAVGCVIIRLRYKRKYD